METTKSNPLKAWLLKHEMSQAELQRRAGSPVQQAKLSLFLTGKIERLSPKAAAAVSKVTGGAVTVFQLLNLKEPAAVEGKSRRRRGRETPLHGAS